ncbi:MAG: acetate--CoA ligase family protein, partial [Candidatus Methanomethylophilaceae archaeon]|nr:acetate--CoA ligase family protein [Candidatus Methanomethylophilaceae archaeon]
RDFPVIKRGGTMAFFKKKSAAEAAEIDADKLDLAADAADQDDSEADVDAMKDTIKRIIMVAVENPEIHELEINPVIVGLKGKGCWAVDALCTLVKE